MLLSTGARSRNRPYVLFYDPISMIGFFTLSADCQDAGGVAALDATGAVL